MFTKKTSGIHRPTCGSLKKVSEALLPGTQSSEPNEISLEQIAQKLFRQHFKTIFYHYDQKANNKQHVVTRQSGFTPTDDDLWIFGYGSLVWKADFPYIDKKQGYIEGYQRRFFQYSIDHRGTLEKPGRVVTLVPSYDITDRVYGMAYRIAYMQKEDVLKHLDYREKNGYERRTVLFIEFGSGTSFDIVMYVATFDNESFAGGDEHELEPIAEQIYTSAGPSGPNREYLYKLADAMRELFPGVEDKHLFELESLVREMERRDALLATAVKEKIRCILEKEDVDEVVKEFVDLVRNCMNKAYLNKLMIEINSKEKNAK